MGIGKGAYLRVLTSRLQQFRSIELGEKLDGSTPPSVFVGRAGYPKVIAGPMLSTRHGDTSLMDTPEQWLSSGQKQPEDIVGFRLQLVRGKALVPVNNVQSDFVTKLQEIALAKYSSDTQAEFETKPRGITFNMDHSPFGPSAPIKSFEAGNVKWEHRLEKVYYDTDLRAGEAVIRMHEKGVLISQIQKAFSVGTMGLGQNRKLVPTRWSITAVDDIIARYLFDRVRTYDVLDTFQVYSFEALKNNFVILLMPTEWQYEWMEAFIHVMGREELIFSDRERFEGKKEYSSVGGCYYSVKMAILEKLEQLKKQAGAIVFREAYSGYIPTGVWLCREETRKALEGRAVEFNDIGSALGYVAGKLNLPLEKFYRESELLRKPARQMRLANFF